VTFDNVYADRERAAAYAKLEFPGTYNLAFRDIPQLIERHVTGGRAALDFGCGAGRSTRFVERLGFTVVGADISAEMLRRAGEADPSGDYRLVADGELGALAGARFDLVFAAFTFDNVPTVAKKERLFEQLRGLLAPAGRIVVLVSAPEIYTHEWASFSTHDFPANRYAQDGDVVRIVMLDVDDRRPVEDELCTDACYRGIFERAGLEVLERHQPLGRPDEPFLWVSETTVSPWSIYVLKAVDGMR
jgi:SAM-dependent methyltransferase